MVPWLNGFSVSVFQCFSVCPGVAGVNGLIVIVSVNLKKYNLPSSIVGMATYFEFTGPVF